MCKMADKYSKCPYFTPGSYVTKPYECDYCGNIAPFEESSIKAKGVGSVVWYGWCKLCAHYISIDKIPTMIQERLIKTSGVYDFVHVCNNVNLHTSADRLKKCQTHSKCWVYMCQKCGPQHVKNHDLRVEVIERLEKVESTSSTQNAKIPEKSVFGVDIAY